MWHAAPAPQPQGIKAIRPVHTSLVAVAFLCYSSLMFGICDSTQLTMIAKCRLVFPVGLSANAVTATIVRQEAKTGPHALLPPTPWDPQQLLSRLLMGRAPIRHLLARLLSGEH